VADIQSITISESGRQAYLQACRSVDMAVSAMIVPRYTTSPALRALATALAWIGSEPRIARELMRRQIDAMLAEDARRCPEFADARRAAVCEAVDRIYTRDARHGRWYTISICRCVLRLCERYEEARGASREPSIEAQALVQEWAGTPMLHALLAYESHRAPRPGPIRLGAPESRRSIQRAPERRDGAIAGPMGAR
jgi:hypothetical protein